VRAQATVSFVAYVRDSCRSGDVKVTKQLATGCERDANRRPRTSTARQPDANQGTRVDRAQRTRQRANGPTDASTGRASRGQRTANRTRTSTARQRPHKRPTTADGEDTPDGTRTPATRTDTPDAQTRERTSARQDSRATNGTSTGREHRTRRAAQAMAHARAQTDAVKRNR
jgi:hypothetical protein